MVHTDEITNCPDCGATVLRSYGTVPGTLHICTPWILESNACDGDDREIVEEESPKKRERKYKNPSIPKDWRKVKKHGR